MTETEEGIAENWRPMVQAAGLYHPLQDAATLFLLGGFLMHDPVVLARCMKKLAAFLPTAEQPYLRDPCLAVLQEMTPSEQAALKERIFQATTGMQAKRAAKHK